MSKQRAPNLGSNRQREGRRLALAVFCVGALVYIAFVDGIVVAARFAAAVAAIPLAFGAVQVLLELRATDQRSLRALMVRIVPLLLLGLLSVFFGFFAAVAYGCVMGGVLAFAMRVVYRQR